MSMMLYSCFMSGDSDSGWAEKNRDLTSKFISSAIFLGSVVAIFPPISLG